MKDLVRVQDYQEYLQTRLKHWEIKNAEVKSQYTKCKVVYEDKFLPKLLRWKFEDSYGGDTSWIGCWDFFDAQVNNCKAEISRCVYQGKIGHTFIIIGDNFLPSGFYKWCSENGIPY